MDEENEGSFLIGFLLGFFLPCIGVIVGIVMQGSRTTTGAISGFLANVLLWLCAGVMFSILRIVLANM